MTLKEAITDGSMASGQKLIRLRGIKKEFKTEILNNII